MAIRPIHFVKLALTLPAVLALAAASGQKPQEALNPAAVELFESKVRPLLADNCFGCHGPDKQLGALRLDSRESVQKGGEKGPIISPGHPDDSLLIQAVR